MFKRARLSSLSVLMTVALLLSACGQEAATSPTAVSQPTPANTTVVVAPTGTVEAVATSADQLPTSTVGTTVTTSGGGELKIGFAFVTSGSNAVYGNSQRAAAELAISEINAAGKGPKITPVFEDTAAKPDQAITVFQKFINSDKVHAIIGPTLSNEAKSSDPEAQKAGVPVLAVSNTAAGITEMGDYIFRDSLAEFQVIPATIREAKAKLNISKVSLLYANDDAFSKSGADVFRTELQANGIQILSEQTFSTNDVDYKAQLTAIKGENPDAIVISALATPAQTILQQARNDVGIDPKVHIIGGNGFNSPAVVVAAGQAAEGVIVGAAWNLSATDELSRKFIESFRTANSKDPDQFAAQAYAGVYIMHDAATRADIAAKSLQDARTAIRDALKTAKDVPTVLGNFSFTDKRDANHPPVVQIVQNGKFAILGATP
ncbi:MAG TPA: ABC transporter substrate-binding protein [Chloroflexia bacterium]|nr:ABC transporter substrate-binding protein [Chloroflexia bacterium]